jgi:hypothetical protein
MAHGQRRNATLTITRKNKTLAVQQTLFSGECHIGSPTGPRGVTQMNLAAPLTGDINTEPSDTILFDVARGSPKLDFQTNDEFVITNGDQKDGTYILQGTANKTSPSANESKREEEALKYRCYVKRKPD